MDIAKCYEYDRETDQVFGPHKKVQLGMARGICESWKQPVFYDFDSPMKLDLLFRIIISLETNGVHVWVVVCDFGNVGLLSELGVSMERTYFPNPFDPERPIFVVPDPPHMLKLLRNHFLDGGLTLGDGTKLVRSDVEALLEKDSSELRICHKLTQMHLDLKGSARQNVRSAAQLFSHTTATALQLLFPQKERQATFIQTANDWFDTMNSRLEKDSTRLRCAYGVHLEEQRSALTKMMEETQNFRTSKRKSLLPFQKGIIIGSKSIMQLFDQLSARYGVRYIRTVCENQDIVENAFSRIRALGFTHTHPGPVACKNRIRLLILGRDANVIIRSASVRADETATSAMSEGSELLTKKVSFLFSCYILQQVISPLF